MGIDHKGHRYCDGCGKTGRAVHRIYKDSEYCGACYKRDFISVACTTCSGTARVHRRAPEPPRCRTCLNGERHCVRCDRLTPIAGRAVPGGVACPSCAVHFGTEAICSGCGKESRRLSSGKGEFEAGRLCNACQNKRTHATCVYCRRHRPRAGTLASGKAYCSDCGPEGGAQHPCPDCGEVQAGGGLGRCRTCLNRDSLEREGRLAALTVSRPWVQQAIVEFAKWLCKERPGDPKLRTLFQSHTPFFERLDAAFESPDALSATAMLDHYSVAGLRKHLIPMSFMRAHFNFQISADQKNEHVERQRIDDILRKSKRCVWLDDLIAYQNWLDENKRPLRTQRLYLSTAAGFLSTLKTKLAEATDTQVRAYLIKTPGVRNNLSGFLRFARKKQLATLTLPALDELPNRQPESAKRLRILLDRISKHDTEAPNALLERAVSVAFGLSPRELRTGGWFADASDNQVVLRNKAESLEVPQELVSIVERWDKHRPG